MPKQPKRPKTPDPAVPETAVPGATAGATAGGAVTASAPVETSAPAKSSARSKTASPGEKRRFPRRLAVILLAVLLLVAIGVSVPVGISLSRRVLTFRGIRVDRSLYACFTAGYRYRYLAQCDYAAKSDTAAFWSRVKDEATGLTYGEDCEAQTRTYILRVITAAYLFDESGETLSAAERATVGTQVADLVTYRFGGDEQSFKSAAAAYGFTARDVRDVYIYELKAGLLPSHISLSSEQIAGYFGEHYRRVQMVVIDRGASDTTRRDAATRYDRVLELSEAEDRIGRFHDTLLDTDLNANAAYRDPSSGAAGDFSSGLYFNPAGKYDTGNDEFDGFVKGAEETYCGEKGEKLIDGEKLLGAIYSLENPGDVTSYTEGGYTFYLLREKPKLDDLSDENYTKTMFSDFNDLAVADYLPSYLDSFAADASWHLSHARAWLPAGADSKLHLFFA